MSDVFKAISDNDLSSLKALLEVAPESASRKNERGVSPVLFAVYHGRAEHAAALVAAGAELGIHEAAALGNLEKVREILSRNPERVNLFSDDGFQPLGLAAFFSHTDVGEYLLAHGADPTTPSRNAQAVAPIHSATASGSYRLVRDLIAAGADVNARQQEGYTALHAAVQNEDSDIVKILIENGADCYAANDHGVRPIDLLNDETRKTLGVLLAGCA